MNDSMVIRSKLTRIIMETVQSLQEARELFAHTGIMPLEDVKRLLELLSNQNDLSVEKIYTLMEQLEQ